VKNQCGYSDSSSVVEIKRSGHGAKRLCAHFLWEKQDYMNAKTLDFIPRPLKCILDIDLYLSEVGV